jgi:cysteine synthase A
MLLDSILDSAGNTPLIRLRTMSSGNVLAKAEFLNPGGSVKDRVARHIVESAEKEGKLRPGMTIIEATSGNTGIGLSLVGIRKGYRVICIMPDNMSEERRRIIQAFGGEIIFSPAEKSLPGSLEKMREITQSEPDRYFVANQFSNPHNPEVHYNETAPEIWEDTDGQVDIFVAGVGSGGTLQGIGTFLKERKPDVKIVAVEPKSSTARQRTRTSPDTWNRRRLHSRCAGCEHRRYGLHRIGRGGHRDHTQVIAGRGIACGYILRGQCLCSPPHGQRP